MRLRRNRTDDVDRTNALGDSDVGRLAMPRRRGAGIGTLLILLGAWGALIPLVGPYFDFVVGPDDAWNMTSGRFWLSLVPGAAAVLGGLLLLSAANRATATLGAQIALAAGVWFAIGPVMSRLWNDGVSETGPALGGTGRQVAEQLAYYPGLGVLIAALAGIALGRVTSRSVRDVERLERAHEREMAPVADRPAEPAADRKAEPVADRDVEPVADRSTGTGRFRARDHDAEVTPDRPSS